MGRIIHVLAILIALVFLGLVLFSLYPVIKHPPPEQAISRFTRYPAWHPPIKNINQGKVDTISVFQIVLEIISGYFMLKWTLNLTTNNKLTTYFVLDGRRRLSTIKFNIFLGLYSLLTIPSPLFTIFFDVGKLLSSVAVLHNSLEMLTVFSMHQEVMSSRWFVGWLMLHCVLVGGVSIFADWPYDAIFFIVQGLSIDIYVVIQFIRTFIVNIRNAGRILVNEDVEDGLNETDGDSAPYVSSTKFSILFLILASFAHTTGNVFFTLDSGNDIFYYIFSFSYCVTFPAYAYFVYLDTHTKSTRPHKLIYIPDTSRWKVIFFAIISITLAFLTVRIGAHITGRD